MRREQGRDGQRQWGSAQQKGWICMRFLRRFRWKLMLKETTVLSGILMESIFLPSPAGTLEVQRKCHFAEITYLYKRAALDSSKCEVSRR